MRVLHALLQSLAEDSCPVSGVYVGPFQTAVTTRSTGLASTCRGAHSCSGEKHEGVKGAGQFLSQDAMRLARLSLSEDTVEASIGFATINSLLTVDESKLHPLGAYDLLAQKGMGKNVAVIGHSPFAGQLKAIVRNLLIVERNPQPGDLDESEAWRVLPDCEVVCLTGTTLTNHTFDDLLALCWGPTSPSRVRRRR